ncbi:MAG: aspartyl/glutamyl-tRNA amidotransferase subunit A [Chloroflexi bacterium]|nr:aspartyl/glutamyl-tRNA amidotransferase subunit A [Chloroflexota bacterium]
MPADDLHFRTIAELAAAFRTGKTSPVAVTAAALDRLHRLQPTLNAYITVLDNEALATARRAEDELRGGNDRGPLHGVPFSLKDLFATRGVRTTCGSNVLADWVPDADATVVGRLRAAGAVLLGKANMHEFAYGPTNAVSAFGPVRNPWDPGRITGGSSGGSGAGLAAGIEHGSLGSDTGGSVRMPAAYCGIVGLKPTYGRVSRAGVAPLSWAMDHVGPMARSVGDVALIMGVIAGHDPRDPTSSRRPVPPFGPSPSPTEDRPLTGVRLGIPCEHFWEGAEPEVLASVRRATETLADLGATLVEATLPHIGLSQAAGSIIIGAEAHSYHEAWLRTRPQDYQAPTRCRLEAAGLTLAIDYVRAQRVRALLCREAEQAFTDVDLLVTPTMPCVAPSFAEADAREHIRYTIPFNLLGLPALSLPCGFGADGMPVGLQIAGRPFDEATVIRVGHAYEQATEWHRRRPEVGADLTS